MVVAAFLEKPEFCRAINLYVVELLEDESHARQRRLLYTHSFQGRECLDGRCKNKIIFRIVPGALVSQQGEVEVITFETSGLITPAWAAHKITNARQRLHNRTYSWLRATQHDPAGGTLL